MTPFIAIDHEAHRRAIHAIGRWSNDDKRWYGCDYCNHITGWTSLAPRALGLTSGERRQVERRVRRVLTNENHIVRIARRRAGR